MLKNISKIIVTFVIISITIITFPIFWMLLFLFYLFKKLLEHYLMIKYRKKFGGMLSASDNMMMEKDNQNNMINTLLIVNMDSSDITDLVQTSKTMIKNGIVENAGKFPKLSSTVHSCCGYGYLLRKDIDIDKCVITVTVKEDSDIKTFEDILEEINKSDLPYDNKFLWQFVFVTGPKEWKLRQNIREDQIHLVLRVHHIFGDGLSIVKTFLGMYSDAPQDLNTFQQVLNKANKNKNILVRLFEFIYITLLLPRLVVGARFIKTKSLGYMQRTESNGNRKFYSNIDTDGTIIHCIKRIKNKIGNTAFVEVVLTAISASLERYSANNCPSIPKAVMTAIPTMNMDMEKREDTIETKNRFGLIILFMPISVKSAILSDRLTVVKKITRKMIKSANHKVVFVLLNYILGLIPNNLVRYFFNLDNFGMCFSNLPALPKIRFLNGFKLEHVVFFGPVKGSSGLSTALITYDGKIHFSLTVNDKVMTNREGCQKIVDDVFHFIRLLDEEVNMKGLPSKFVNI